MESVPITAAVPQQSTCAVPQDAPALSKKKQKKVKKICKKIAVVPGSTDVMVQHTNDDSVVSKRSAITHKYLEDGFLRHFVKKPSRRSPLINRGYYLRMKAITDVVCTAARQFIESRSSASPAVQVISLGAGYDTLALRTLLSSCDESTKGQVRLDGGSVFFYDVDFPAVMQAKAGLMEAAPAGTFPSTWCIQHTNAEMPVSSSYYRCLGVDLREATAVLLPQLQRSCSTFSADSPTVIYAECMMQYMPPVAAAELIHCLASNFSKAVFIAYDQVHPADSFGAVMRKSLKEKNSPLLGIDAAPDGVAMTQRALAQGMAAAYYTNFYDLSRHCISGEEKRRVDALEHFDESEEWSEMCEHYGITMAATCVDDAVALARRLPFFRSSADLLQERAALTAAVAATKKKASSEGGETHISVRTHPWPSGRFAFEGWGNGEAYAEKLPDKDVVIVSFGGLSAAKGHHRVNTVFAHSLRNGELKTLQSVSFSHSQSNSDALSACAPPALVFHSFSRLAPFVYLVIGGRTNPTDVNKTAFLLTARVVVTPGGISGGRTVFCEWQQLTIAAADAATCATSPEPRFRHTAVALNDSQVLVHGGRAASGAILGDTWIATVDSTKATISWRQLHIGAPNGESLPAACSAACLALSPNEVLLSGGLTAEGTCNDIIWRVQLGADGNATVTRGVACGPAGARYSHSMTRVRLSDSSGSATSAEYVLLLGGCWENEKQSMNAAVLVDLPGLSTFVTAPLPSGSPSWSRHSCIALGEEDPGVVAVIGGGYTCFSFGTFTSRPILLTLSLEMQNGEGAAPGVVAEDPLNVSTASCCSTSRPSVFRFSWQRETVGAAASMRRGSCPSIRALLPAGRPPVRELLYTPENFLKTVKAAMQPVIFRNVDLGACMKRWNDSAYLKECEPDTIVSVHVASGSHLLDFVRKNFVFRHVSFPDLIRNTEDALAFYRDGGTEPEETWYYRSIATHMKSERANIWNDFKTLGKDFVLPSGAREYIMPRVHQSCMRINAPPLQLWTHYDTFDNVLCQIVGRKRVVLFPPSEYNNLYMAGSSSPVINIDAPDLLQYPRFIDACKSAIEVIMNPGDMLFFPAQWFHHITTLDDTYSVSVNVFFEHFDAADYDKRDLYGNKDLPACVDMREDIVRLAQERMRGTTLTGTGKPVPPEYTEFALRRAIQELEQVADAMAAERRAERAAQ